MAADSRRNPKPKPKPACGGKGGCFTNPPGDSLEERYCHCGYGYPNKEGTFIPGSLVRSLHALKKDQYREHQDCQTCAIGADSCRQRQKYLSSNAAEFGKRPPSNPGSQLEYYEFFVPEVGLQQRHISHFLDRNTEDNNWAISSIKFRGKSGYLVKSPFRFNQQDIKQLRSLTHIIDNGKPLQKSDIIRQYPGSAPKAFNEFTSFLTIEPGTRHDSGVYLSDESQKSLRHRDSNYDPEIQRSDTIRPAYERPNFRHGGETQISARGHQSLVDRTRPSQPRKISPERRRRQQASPDESRGIPAPRHSRETLDQPEGSPPAPEARGSVEQQGRQDSGGRYRHARDPQPPRLRSEEEGADENDDRPNVQPPKPAMPGEKRHHNDHHDSTTDLARSRQNDHTQSVLYNRKPTVAEVPRSRHSDTKMVSISDRVSGDDPSQNDRERGPTSRPVETKVDNRIDIDVLDYYLKLLDIDARIDNQHSDLAESHIVRASRALEQSEILEMAKDQRDWASEKRTSEYKRKRYNYAKSDVADRRKGILRAAKSRPDRSDDK